ncbi:MAG TPA: NAD(P)H-dependent oxidoreductase, partial [Polyangiales bacterium]|nr:NAD(P)H-dependent oxidoreductase [Polyangiales bacterium]
MLARDRMIDLVYAHPYPHRSRANHLMLAAVRDLPGLEIRSLYDLYPDFSIDVDAEQEALLRARIVVWQHPTYWYSVP